MPSEPLLRHALGDLGRRLGPVVLAIVVTVTAGITDAARAAGALPLTLAAGRVLRPDGTLEDNVSVVVEKGKIKGVGAAEGVKGGEVRRFDPQSVVCPGLIDLFSSIGAVGQAVETASFVDPNAEAVDAVDPTHRDFHLALRSGVTAAMVAPAPSNLVSGVCAAFRTYAPGGKLDVLRDDGPLVFALGEGVWRSDRVPTSRAGALSELRTLIEAAREEAAPGRINAVVAGRLDALIVCSSAHDVASARSELGELFDRFALVHTGDAIDLAADLEGLRRPVVVGPYGFGSSRRVILGAAALANSGVEVAFRGGLPQSAPDAMRITAALAVRYGMDPAAARRAITVAPAKVAGVANRIGTISPGKDADLVVFSRDPLRLDAVVLEVYVRGVRVYRAANHDSSPAGARP